MPQPCPTASEWLGPVGQAVSSSGAGRQAVGVTVSASKVADMRPMRMEDSASPRTIHTTAKTLPSGVTGILSP
eukprot:2108434-Prymnesium_polylepis.1